MNKKTVILLITAFVLMIVSSNGVYAKQQVESEVGITFTLPDDPEELKRLKEEREEIRQKQVKEVKTIYMDTPTDDRTYTIITYNNGQERTFIY